MNIGFDVGSVFVKWNPSRLFQHQHAAPDGEAQHTDALADKLVNVKEWFDSSLD